MPWYHRRPVPPYLIACDFDGTITRFDTLHLIVGEFGDGAVWDAIEPRLNAGEVSIEQAMEAEFATVRATPAEVLGMLRERAGIRAGFHDFVAWAEREGHPMVILSNGFATVIGDLLHQAGLRDLEFHSHDAVFSPDGTRIVWADRGERCGLCNRPCKRFDLARRRDSATRVVYVGDGISDRCVAGAADLVFARAGLAQYLAGIGTPFVPFEDFHDVRAHLVRDAEAA